MCAQKHSQCKTLRTQMSGVGPGTTFDYQPARLSTLAETVNFCAPSSSSSLLSSLELSDTQVYEPWIRALLGTASHFCSFVYRPPSMMPAKLSIEMMMGEHPAARKIWQNTFSTFFNIKNSRKKSKIEQCQKLNVQPHHCLLENSRPANSSQCSGFKAGSYLRLIYFVYHSTLGWRVIKKKKGQS